MMGICERSFGANSEPSKYKSDGGECYGHYLEVDVSSKSPTRISTIKSCSENCCWNYKEKCDGCYYAMAFNQGVVLWKVSKSIAHSYGFQMSVAPLPFNDISAKEVLPLYCIVSKFNPTKFGNRNVFLDASQVPSPTYIVFEEYMLLPGGDRLSSGAITTAICRREAAQVSK